MATLQIREAIRRAMSEEMRSDDRIFLMGEEVAQYQGAYKVSKGMFDEFGPTRVVEIHPSARAASRAWGWARRWSACAPSSSS